MTYFILYRRLPPTSLTVSAHYERMVDIFGGKGFFCQTIPELQSAMKSALMVSLIQFGRSYT